MDENVTLQEQLEQDVPYLTEIKTDIFVDITSGLKISGSLNRLFLSIFLYHTLCQDLYLDL
jgi:hypothetical protein